MRRLILAALVFVAAACSSGYATRSAASPEAARVVTDDLARFYAVFDALPDSASAEDAARRFRADYFEPGSDGLRAFRSRTGDDETFARAVLARRAFYRAIRPAVLDQAASRALADSMRAAYRALAAVYPDARFPDVYLVVGKLSSGGTVRRPGVVMGTEHFSGGPRVPTDELSAWQRQAVSGARDRLPILVHEAMHAQQRRFRQRTRALRAVAEGCPDYLTERLVGRHPNADAEAWALPRRAEITAEFLAGADSTDLGDWFFDVPARPGDPGRPVDLGYTVGKWICEAYVENANDPSTALHDVVRLEDPERIVRESGLLGRAERHE